MTHIDSSIRQLHIVRTASSRSDLFLNENVQEGFIAFEALTRGGGG